MNSMEKNMTGGDLKGGSWSSKLRNMRGEVPTQKKSWGLTLMLEIAKDYESLRVVADLTGEN